MKKTTFKQHGTVWSKISVTVLYRNYCILIVIIYLLLQDSIIIVLFIIRFENSRNLSIIIL